MNKFSSQTMFLVVVSKVVVEPCSMPVYSRHISNRKPGLYLKVK